MHLHPPAMVLVPDTFLSTSDASSQSMLVEYIYERFPGVPVEPIGRKYWNETSGRCRSYRVSTYSTESGLEFVSQLCIEDDERAGTLLAVANKCAYIHLFSTF
jgi:DNA mismatch repair protein MSH4